MPRGGARPGAGRPRKAPELHALDGTKPSPPRRVRPAALTIVPHQGAAWAPTTDHLATITPAGRAFIEELLGRYELGAVEGHLLLEAAHCVGELAALREVNVTERSAREQATRQRFMLAWSKQLAALLGQLQIEAQP